MNKYEILYILDAKLDDAAKDAACEKYSALVKEQGGEVESVDKWGLKKFAYPMDARTEGFYALMNFSSAPEFPAELERRMRIDENVVRYMVVKK